MLAFSWFWQGDDEDLALDMARRLATSLCAGIGGHAGHASLHGAAFAYRSLRSDPATARAWRPARLPNDTVVLFHGHISNSGELRAALGSGDVDPGVLYGQSVARWGNDADRRIIGEYCAIVAAPAARSVRLSRSPLRAPPLHYFRNDRQITAASVPRSVFAAGVPCRVNYQRVADSNWMNFSDESASWYQGLARVPLGAIVESDPGGLRETRYYDPMDLPEVRLASDREYIDRAGELLDDGVRAALDGSKRPGATLSSGLDSSQVAARALRCLSPEQGLPCFTFVPEPGWDGIVSEGMLGDEGAMVRAFAALHPRLQPHFTANEGRAQDYRWSHMFHAMGAAPSGMCNMYPFHGIWQLARDQGCDRLLLAEWGNATFSAKGEWGFVEYLLKGRWRQLYRALRDHPHDRRSLPRRFAALSLVPLLPDAAWRRLMGWWHPGETGPLELISPLSPGFRERMAVEERARQAGVNFSRFRSRDRLDARRKLFANADCEVADTYQAFEQLYGVEQRDPTAYRPFVEFCLGLPTELFLRDGESRWLAKQMAKGIMSDAQRANSLNGCWDADWHLRIGRKREEWLGALTGIETDPKLGSMLDIPRLRAALEHLPAETDTDPQVWMPVRMAVPRALLAARFVEYVEGRNDLAPADATH